VKIAKLPQINVLVATYLEKVLLTANVLKAISSFKMIIANVREIYYYFVNYYL